MKRLLSVGAGTVAALLVLSACTGSDDPEPTATPTPTSSETDAATTAEPAPFPAEGNACTVLPEDDVDPLNPRDRELVNTLISGDMVFDGCTVGRVHSLSFGIRITDGEATLADEVQIVAGSEAEPLDGLGDEAFIARRPGFEPGDDPLTVAIGARFGDHEVFLRNESLGNSNPEEHVTEEQTIEFLRAYGAAIPDDFEQAAQRTEVGEGCLDPEAEVLTAIVGTVQLARGGYSGDEVQCAYLGDDSTTVRLSRSPASNAEDFVSIDPSFEEELELADAVTAKINGSDGNFSVTVQPAEQEIAFASVSGGAASLGRDDLVPLVEEFLAGSR